MLPLKYNSVLEKDHLPARKKEKSLRRGQRKDKKLVVLDDDDDEPSLEAETLSVVSESGDLT